jgi:hypothetical protein
MEALDFETERTQNVASAWLGKTGAQLAPFAGCSEQADSDVSSGYSTLRGV